MRLGIDVGSTTVKLILLDKFDKIVYEKYERHMSNVFEKVQEIADAKGAKYPLTKKWFLKSFPEYKENAVELSEEEILGQMCESLSDEQVLELAKNPNNL